MNEELKMEFEESITMISPYKKTQLEYLIRMIFFT